MYSTQRVRNTAVSVIAGLALGLGAFALAPAPAMAAGGLSGFASALATAAAGSTQTGDATETPDATADGTALAEDGSFLYDGAIVEGAFQPIVMADDENVYACITGIRYEGGKYIMTVDIENRADTKTMFNMDDVYVNDWDCDPFWAHSVEAGTVETVEISWGSWTLDNTDIGENAEKFTFKFEAYDNEDWSKEDYFENYYTIYLTGSQTYERTTIDLTGCPCIYEDESVRMYVVGSEDTSLYVYFETADVTASAEIDAISINGVSLYGSAFFSLAPNTRGIEEFNVSSSSLETAGIESMDSLSVLYEITDTGTYNKIADGVVTIMGAENDGTVSRQASASDVVVVDNDRYTITAYDAAYDDFGSLYLYLHIVNKTDMPLTFSSSKTYMDGTELYGSLYTVVLPQTECYCYIQWSSYTLSGAGIEADNVQEVQVALNVSNTLNYSAYNATEEFTM